MKIFETIRYIVEELGFIPNKITVYEDRPIFFIENISSGLLKSFNKTVNSS